MSDRRAVPGALPAERWAPPLVVLLCVLSASLLRLSNAEIFMRLALGRLALTRGLRLPADPYLYSVAQAPFVNPEWLADLLLYGTYQLGGEAALVALRVLLVALGGVLLLTVARRAGAAPLPAAAVVSLALLAVVPRFSERNDLHLTWLVPVYQLLLQVRSRLRRLWLLPLGLLWVNLHGSFMVGWALLAIRLIDERLRPERPKDRDLILVALLLVHPILPLCTPYGTGTYRFVWDHLAHAELLRSHIGEWASPDVQDVSLRGLALHLLVLAALASGLLRRNRREVGRFALIALAALFAYRAVRFAPLSAWLLAAPLSANLTGVAASRRVAAAALAASSLLAGGLIFEARRGFSGRPHPLSPEGGAAAAARWLGRAAPPGSRVFHPFNQSQLLMWLAPQTKLFITAHTPYVSFAEWRRASTSARTFEEVTRRHRVAFVLLYRDPASTAPEFWTYLGAHPGWRAVYTDGVSAVFARADRRGDSPGERPARD